MYCTVCCCIDEYGNVYCDFKGFNAIPVLSGNVLLAGVFVLGRLCNVDVHFWIVCACFAAARSHHVWNCDQRSCCRECWLLK